MLTNMIIPWDRNLNGSTQSIYMVWNTQEMSANSASVKRTIFTEELTLNLEERIKIHQEEQSLNKSIWHKMI